MHKTYLTDLCPESPFYPKIKIQSRLRGVSVPYYRSLSVPVPTIRGPYETFRATNSTHKSGSPFWAHLKNKLHSTCHGRVASMYHVHCTVVLGASQFIGR